MAERLNREALYDLVWSEAMMTLSARFQISDVALKKTCARAGIPTSERGYWAKKDAGKDVFQAAFPSRPPGVSDEIEIGAGSILRMGTGPRKTSLLQSVLPRSSLSQSTPYGHASSSTLLNKERRMSPSLRSTIG